MARAIFFSKSW